MAQPLPRRDRLLAVPHPLPCRGQRRHLCDQTDRFAEVRLFRHVLGVGVEPRESGCRGPQRGHRMGASREQTQQVQDGRGSRAFALELAAEVGEPCGIGQLTVQQQVTDFLERRVLGQVLDLVTPVDETSFLAVDLAQLCFCNDNAL